MHDARTQRPTAVTFTCAYASVSVRARAPRGSSACDHLAECHAELFPLRASLRFATSTLCFFLSRHLYVLYFIYIYTFEEERSSIVAIEANLERSIVRKDGISSNDAKVKRFRFDRSSRFIDSPVPARPNTFLSIIHRRIAARERPTTFRANLERAEHGSAV